MARVRQCQTFSLRGDFARGIIPPSPASHGLCAQAWCTTGGFFGPVVPRPTAMERGLTSPSQHHWFNVTSVATRILSKSRLILYERMGTRAVGCELRSVALPLTDDHRPSRPPARVPRPRSQASPSDDGL